MKRQKSLAVPIWNFDEEGISIISQSFVQNDLIAGLNVMDSSGSPCSGTRMRPLGQEIRTPMNGIIGMTDILFDTDLDKEQLDYARNIKISSEALLGIINKILDFLKIEAGKLDFEMMNFDIRITLEEITQMLTIKADEKGIEMAWNWLILLLRGEFCLMPHHRKIKAPEF